MKIRAIILILFSLVLGIGEVANSQTVCGSWDFVSSPNNGQEENRLRSISAVSEDDIWAVGFYDASSGSSFLPRGLITHWDGANWNIVPSPAVGISGDFLFGVTAIATDDVWAVGFSSTFGEAQALTLHWNGSTWSVVPSPTYTGGSALWAVGAISANEVWAVGERVLGAPGPTGGTLTLRWDGSGWEEVLSPNPPGTAENNSLYAIGIVSNNDIWAVGEHDVPGNFKHAMILHWDGSSWTIVPNPHSNSNWDKEIVAVAGTASNDVWTSGVIQTSNGVQPLFMHWDGFSWSVVSSPGGVAPYFGGRGGLASISQNDVWAVGRTIAHWDGSSWNLVDFTSPGVSAELHAVAKISSCDLWAAGDYYDGNTSVTLFEHLTAGAGGIACEDVFFFNAKCNANGAAQAMVKISGDHAGETATFDLDGSPQVVTLQSNGTNSIGKMTVPHAGMGSHTVTLVDPAACYAPVTFNCQVDAPPDPEWDALWVGETIGSSGRAIPSETGIIGNYPNPFNPSTAIRYALNDRMHVSLKVYSVIGEEVASLVDELQEEGYHDVVFNATNLASGIYLYRLVAGDAVDSGRLVVMK